MVKFFEKDSDEYGDKYHQTCRDECRDTYFDNCSNASSYQINR